MITQRQTTQQSREGDIVGDGGEATTTFVSKNCSTSGRCIHVHCSPSPSLSLPHLLLPFLLLLLLVFLLFPPLSFFPLLPSFLFSIPASLLFPYPSLTSPPPPPVPLPSSPQNTEVVKTEENRTGEQSLLMESQIWAANASLINHDSLYCIWPPVFHFHISTLHFSTSHHLTKWVNESKCYCEGVTENQATESKGKEGREGGREGEKEEND